MIEWVQKRDGRVVPFNPEKIADAIFAAAKAVGGEDRRQAEFLAGQVIHLLGQEVTDGGPPEVEQIQDLVEKVLIEHGHARTAKAYILYRNRRTRIREQKSELMDAVSEVLQESGLELPEQTTPAAKFRRIALAASGQYVLHSLLPREFATAHQRAVIHIDRMADYSLSVAACAITPETLVTTGLRLGHIRLEPAQDLAMLVRMVCQLVTVAQNELIGELLFVNIDQAFAKLGQASGDRLEPMTLQPIVTQMLADLELTRQLGGSWPTLVSMSVGLEHSPEGENFVQVLLAALAAGLPSGAPVMSPQVLYQVPADGTHTEMLQQALTISRQRGNPSLVLVGGSFAPTFASGLRLSDGEPGLLSCTYVNLPRIALEASSSSELWAGIDNVLSLAVRQLVHRYEVLSVLPEQDLPLLLQNRLWGVAAERPQVKDELQSGQLAVVPIGTQEVLQVARMRFGSEIALAEADLIHLLGRIVEHWRGHYGLRLTLGQPASEFAARRFAQADQLAFPLARTIWPKGSTYQLATPSRHFNGGQFSGSELPADPLPGVVFAGDFPERRCAECGQVLQDGPCPLHQWAAPISVRRVGGYLHSL